MTYNMPEDFRLKLQCEDCDYSVDMRGLDTMSVIDDSLAKHIESYNHTKYKLEIYDINIESMKERKDIVNLFEHINDAVLLSDLISTLKDSGYNNSGEMIKDAIENGILYIDEIEDENTIYIALTDKGEDIWEAIE